MNADPVADANAAAKRGDFRYLALQGYSARIPGFETNEALLTNAGAFRVIEGTSDVLYDADYRHLLLSANRYAYLYNIQLRKLVPATTNGSASGSPK